MSFKYGLNLPASKKNPVNKGGPVQRRNVFSSLDQDDDDDEHYFDDDNAAPGRSSNAGQPSKTTPADEAKRAQERVNRELRQAHERAAARQVNNDVDPSIYAYDEVYDEMKSAERQRQAEIRGNNKERKVTRKTIDFIVRIAYMK
jgi:hypothetical protein